MRNIERLASIMKDNEKLDFLIEPSGKTWTYLGLSRKVLECESYLLDQGIEPGDVVALQGDYMIDSVAALLALLDLRCIVIPYSFVEVSRMMSEVVRYQWIVTSYLGWTVTRTSEYDTPTLYQEIREREHPCIVLLSSGTSGKPKAVVHDAENMLDKYDGGKQLTTLAFLLFDHIGGLNTLFYTLFAGGKLVNPGTRQVVDVLHSIEQYQVELLPTTPTFLQIVLMSDSSEFDTSALKYISYGTEAMPPVILEKLQRAFPNAKLKQTYGLSETGIVSSLSKDSGSLLLKLDPKEYKIVDDILWLKTKSSMLGYLNAPAPFDEEGYFNTEDMVRVEGDYIRILGKQSTSINVGGLKVSPIEVENVLLSHPKVKDVAIYKEKNLLMGWIVCARVVADPSVTPVELRRWCEGKLPRVAIPVKVRFVDEICHTERYKKNR